MLRPALQEPEGRYYGEFWTGLGGIYGSKGTSPQLAQSNQDMILLDNEEHYFIGHDYSDLTNQLLEHLRVDDDDTLIALAAAALRCDELEIIITRVDS